MCIHDWRRAAALAIFACLPAASVWAASDWDNYQGNAQHTGYVAKSFNPASFRQAWQWTSPHAADGVMRSINAVTMAGGLIAVTDDDYFSPQALYVLDELTGQVQWVHEFPSDTPGLNPPTLHDGHVSVATSGHEATFMHQFDAQSGTLLWKTPFSAQWEHYLAPLVGRGTVNTNGGYYGGLYTFKSKTGVQRSFTSLPQVDLYTPATDGVNNYVYAGDALHIISRDTGAVTSIVDPAPSSTCCYSYIGAPIVTQRQRVLALSGENFSGRASASTGGYYDRAVVSFDLQGKILEWRSSNLYTTQPALANGLVYAGSRAPLRLAAMDETNGRVQWSWTPTDGASQFCRNVIATQTHVFVSTDKAVHAIDLSTHQSVWSIAVPGELALSATGTLTINEGCRESTGRMVAVRLK